MRALYDVEVDTNNATNPFLTEGVLEVVDSRVPRLTNAEQAGRPEAGLGHDGKVRVERRTDLDQSQLAVRHAQQPAAAPVADFSSSTFPSLSLI